MTDCRPRPARSAGSVPPKKRRFRRALASREMEAYVHTLLVPDTSAVLAASSTRAQF